MHLLFLQLYHISIKILRLKMFNHSKAVGFSIIIAISFCSYTSSICLPTCRTDSISLIKTCAYHVIFDPFPSVTGYFTFAECGKAVAPTIGVYQNIVTEFLQYDASNWYHPMGFGYDPDGLHKSNGNDERELDPGVTKTGSSCKFNNTCMSPMYFLNGAYLGGSYSNIPSTIIDPAGANNDFGLDGAGKYEESFYVPRGQWVDKGEWSVKLNWTDNQFTQDIFYFCHIHDNMSGRIKVVNSAGVPLQAADIPALGYQHAVQSAYDATCGTNGLSAYADTCPKTSFLCTEDSMLVDGDNEDGSRRLSIDAERKMKEISKASLFSECLHSMDCAMHHDMKIMAHPTNPAATFMYQMIPHHINAINMAKSLLNLDYLKCNTTTEGGRRLQSRAYFADGNVEDEYAAAGSNCEMVDLLWSIVNEQNYQVMQMNNWLEKQENIDNEATHCPAEVEPGVTDTAVPFFIILGILATFVLMIILSLRVFQLGLRSGRDVEYKLMEESLLSGVGSNEMNHAL